MARRRSRGTKRKFKFKRISFPRLKKFGESLIQKSKKLKKEREKIEKKELETQRAFGRFLIKMRKERLAKERPRKL